MLKRNSVLTLNNIKMFIQTLPQLALQKWEPAGHIY